MINAGCVLSMDRRGPQRRGDSELPLRLVPICVEGFERATRDTGRSDSFFESAINRLQQHAQRVHQIAGPGRRGYAGRSETV